MPRPSSAARACRTPAGCRRTRDDRRQSNPGPTGASRTRRARTTPAPARRACRRGPPVVHTLGPAPPAGKQSEERLRSVTGRNGCDGRSASRTRGTRHDDSTGTGTTTREQDRCVAERRGELPGPGFGCTVRKAEQSGVVELDGHVEQGVQAVGPAKTRRLADLPHRNPDESSGVVNTNGKTVSVLPRPTLMRLCSYE